MAPKDYERYIFQKGISDQLRFAITDTSFLTQQEQEDLASFRFHKRKGSYILIPYKSIKKKINVTEKEAFEEVLKDYGFFFLCTPTCGYSNC